MKRKKRVRVHLLEQAQGQHLPSVEGLLISKRSREYMIAMPALLVAAEANPAELDSKWLVIPRERVAFYEVLS